MKPRKSHPKTTVDPMDYLSQSTGDVTIIPYRKGKAVFSQGSSCDAVFYLKKGQAKVTVISTQGKEAVLTILNPGDFFGEGSLKGNSKHLSSVRTMTESVIMRISKNHMAHTIQSHPEFADAFIAHLLNRNGRAEEDLVDQLFNSSEKRLARTLLLLANFGKAGDPERVLPKISQKTLAEMIGTTRARVTHFMNKFRKMGLIEYNGHIEVHRALLNVVHDNPKISREG